jgi:hypothetical protein
VTSHYSLWRTTYIRIFVDDEVDDDGGALLKGVDGVEEEEGVADVSLRKHLARVTVDNVEMNLDEKRNC